MIIDSPIISGSYAASGSLNQVGDITITGSLIVTGGITGSVTNAVSASYAATASFALNVPETASYATTAANAQNSDLLDNKNSTEFAVTSSNIFTGQQRITNTTNPTSFTDVASLYTDGGLRVTKDTYISGSAFIAGNFTVFGTSSIEYVTSSTFIGLEYIDLNTDLPALRYAGIRVYDSGSPSESTSSLLWDSQNNKWIYSNPSTVGYSGGMLISGPRNTGSLGNEQGTTNNVIVKGQGGDHITSSQIIDDGTTVTIPGNLTVTGSIVGSLTGTATSASYWSGSIINAQSASFWSGSVVNAQSASFSETASFWSGSITNALSSSFASTASFALNVPETASFALTASYWSGSVANVLSSSYALTASYATNAGAGAGFPFSGSAIITGSLQVTNLTGSGTAYLIADSTGSILRQNASAALRNTQAFTSSANQTSFTVTNGYTTGYVDVFINGTKLSAGEFTDTSGTNIVLTTGSFDGDIVEVVKYLPAEGVSTNVLRTQTNFIATAGQTVFSASYAPGLLDIFYNGSKLSYTEYTANNGTYFTLATASNAGDVLDVFNYSYQIGGFSGIGGNGAISQIPYFYTTHSITGSPNFTISGSTMTVTGSLIVSGSGTFTNIGPAVLNGTTTLSGSAVLTGSLNVSGAIVTNSTITAQTLVVQTITSSVSVMTGSTNFGSLLANTHTFTGSLNVTGALAVTTNGTEFQVNPTGVNLGNALTDSHIISGSVRINPNGLFVSSSGNVGIGTTNPATRFDLSGSIGNFQIASSGAEIFLTRNENNDILATGGTSSGITIGAQSYVRFSVGTSYTERMRINSAGNLGIGISPYAWNSIFIGFDFVNKGGVNSYTNYLSLSQNLYYGSDALDGWRYKTTGFGSAIHLESDSGDVTFRSTGTSGTANGAATLAERMRIRSNGNVGIGTSTPNFILQVNKSDGGASVTQYTNADTGTASSNGLLCGIDSGEDGLFFHQGAKALRFGTSDTERMRITSGGNVGIGTTSPQAELDVVDPSYNQYTLRVQSSAGNNANGWGGIGLSGEGANTKAAILFLSDGGSFSRGSILFCNNSDFNQNNATPANERMRITSSGLVSIANLAGSGTRTVTADSSGYLSAASDSSLKQEDTTHIVEGLAEILQLQPRAYKWLSDIERRGDEAATEIGFFANEVAPIIPSAAPKSNDGLYGFYDRAIIAALTKAIQEQQATITSLQTRIEQLENK
jgi:hypothetical protein